MRSQINLSTLLEGCHQEDILGWKYKILSNERNEN
jgi:hypothetical protein